MRWYLIDYAKKHHRRLKVKHVPVEDFEGVLAGPILSAEEAILVDELLKKLRQKKPEWAIVVEMKAFGAYTDQEIADVMNISVSVMEKMWRIARLWLLGQVKKVRNGN
jgi:DNA-directed RNA polymerase specialized sigma24 family protein